MKAPWMHKNSVITRLSMSKKSFAWMVGCRATILCIACSEGIFGASWKRSTVAPPMMLGSEAPAERSPA